ncbi:MAG: hypothetical protein D6767_08000 [Candidatus Hydrogenedentota bacterium]|nr:MAG: hypothetical protein D6767_08000 [Candidatus Hydrogenedentota bacterium]
MRKIYITLFLLSVILHCEKKQPPSIHLNQNLMEAYIRLAKTVFKNSQEKQPSKLNEEESKPDINAVRVVENFLPDNLKDVDIHSLGFSSMSELKKTHREIKQIYTAISKIYYQDEFMKKTYKTQKIMEKQAALIQNETMKQNFLQRLRLRFDKIRQEHKKKLDSDSAYKKKILKKFQDKFSVENINWILFYWESLNDSDTSKRRESLN